MRPKAAFTIIELLVAITVIALLTTAATANYLVAQRRARDNARKAQVNIIANAVESYYSLNQKFPGLIDLATTPLPVAGASSTPAGYNAIYQNCQTIDTTSGTPPGSDPTYFYYYYPLSGAAGGSATYFCSDGANTHRPVLTNAAGTSVYDPSTYFPAPTWIPGLGPFLSPFPVDHKYQGLDGTNNGVYSEVTQADDTVNKMTRTFVYRKLQGGYAVYSRLEGSDKDIIAGGTTFNDAPILPSDITTINGVNVYMVRK